MSHTSQNPRTTDFDRLLGENIKTLRINAGLSQQKLADYLGLTYQQVQKYETGANRLPVIQLYKLRQLYDVPFDNFFQDTDALINGTPAATDTTAALLRGFHRLKNRTAKDKALKIIEILAS